MNFFKREPSSQMTGAVDLDQGMADTLTDRLRRVPPLDRPAHEFAPQRIEKAIEHIESFTALPMKSIDETLAELTAEYNATLAMGQTIRDTMMAVRIDYLAQIEKQKKFMSVAKETFAALAQKVAALDAPKQDETEQQQVEPEQDAGEHEQGAA